MNQTLKMYCALWKLRDRRIFDKYTQGCKFSLKINPPLLENIFFFHQKLCFWCLLYLGKQKSFFLGGGDSMDFWRKCQKEWKKLSYTPIFFPPSPHFLFPWGRGGEGCNSEKYMHPWIDTSHIVLQNVLYKSFYRRLERNWFSSVRTWV